MGDVQAAAGDAKAVANRLARLFGEVFETEAVAPDDDFFDLGGNSLIAEKLMIAIEREFSVSLAPSVLLRNSTPLSLADAVVVEERRVETDEKPEPCLAPVRPDGEGPPLLCVHGMHGNSTFSRQLAELLILRRQIFGFRALGLYRGEDHLPTVAKIAAHYLAEIRAVRPAGPYLLYGQCPTAVIAYEMAQQLLKAGKSVAGLILVDPYPPLPWMQYTGMDLMRERASLAAAYSRVIARTPVGGYLTAAGRRKQVFDLFRPITGAYAPKPYAGKTLLICTRLSVPILLNKTTGFPALLSSLEIAEVGASHLDPFKGDAPEVSALIEDFLDRVAPI